MIPIRKAAVLGAGTMGAQIAAHFANAGVETLLLDVTADAAQQGLARARALKPDPFFTRDSHALIRTGGFDEVPALRSADWIVEAIVERLDAKQALVEQIEPHTAAAAIVSSNTSGIPLSTIAAQRGEAFRRRWLGTHFFNPPRYLQLLEIIPTGDTDPNVVQLAAAFAEQRLGKGVVIAKDTPGFIANRIGVYGLMAIFRALASGGFTIEEIDAITGEPIGRPKSATFRTADIAGLDVLAAVARGLGQRLDGEGDVFALPPVVEELVRRGWTGAKNGKGFYRKNEAGVIEALDPERMEYRPSTRPRLASIEAGRGIADTAERLRTLFRADDKAGALLRATLAPTLVYAAKIAPSIARTPDDVDRAIRWGFGWELGPFETIRALGVDAVAGALPADQRSEALPALQSVAAQPASDDKETADRPGWTLLKAARDRGAVVRKNSGASLVDVGDGVLCVEFHSKMNSIGGDTLQMLQLGVELAAKDFAALVVANDAQHFSAGANLMLLLLEAQEGNWDEVELMVRSFQQTTAALRYAPVPVVVCPAGLALGGSCEMALHADRIQAAAETYIGLVEVGVGLIPAGGGTKEMLARATDHLPGGADVLPFVQRAFETIGFGVVSTSAADARRIGYLREADGITMNRDRLLADAKAVALARARVHVPARPRAAIPVGGPSVRAALNLGVHLAHRAGRISDHDAVIGRWLARILSGGDVTQSTTLTEQQLLDLEREAFLSLCGERKTQERIAHTLKTGKTLRN